MNILEKMAAFQKISTSAGSCRKQCRSCRAIIYDAERTFENIVNCPECGEKLPEKYYPESEVNLISFRAFLLIF